MFFRPKRERNHLQARCFPIMRFSSTSCFCSQNRFTKVSVSSDISPHCLIAFQRVICRSRLQPVKSCQTHLSTPLSCSNRCEVISTLARPLQNLLEALHGSLVAAPCCISACVVHADCCISRAGKLHEQRWDTSKAISTASLSSLKKDLTPRGVLPSLQLFAHSLLLYPEGLQQI